MRLRIRDNGYKYILERDDDSPHGRDWRFVRSFYFLWEAKNVMRFKLWQHRRSMRRDAEREAKKRQPRVIIAVNAYDNDL